LAPSSDRLHLCWSCVRFNLCRRIVVHRECCHWYSSRVLTLLAPSQSINLWSLKRIRTIIRSLLLARSSTNSRTMTTLLTPGNYRMQLGRLVVRMICEWHHFVRSSYALCLGRSSQKKKSSRKNKDRSAEVEQEEAPDGADDQDDAGAGGKRKPVRTTSAKQRGGNMSEEVWPRCSSKSRVRCAVALIWA